MEKFIDYISDIKPLVVLFGTRLLLAAVVLVVGLWLIRLGLNALDKLMAARGLDVSLRPFLSNIINILFKVVLLVSVVSILGVETTSFIAVIGSVGLAIGLALQGSLSNFAGGILLLTIKPFKVGDYISAGGDSGTVHVINIFNTILRTPDNQVVYVPNGKLAGSTIVNFSQETTRRLVITWGISYKDDIIKAKQILSDIIKADSRVLADPAPSIVVSGLGESSVDIDTRIWCLNGDYWDLNFGLRESIKLKFDEEGISIPFPQRDLHIIPAVN